MSRANTDKAEKGITDWIADLTDPDSFLRTMFESSSANNLFGYDSGAADEMMARGAMDLPSFSVSPCAQRDSSSSVNCGHSTIPPSALQAL